MRPWSRDHLECLAAWAGLLLISALVFIGIYTVGTWIA